MTNEGAGDTAEFRIEEAVTDLVEHLFDRITAEDDWFDEKMSDLAEELGIQNDVTADDYDESKYGEMVNHISLGAWLGLIGKLNQHMFEKAVENAIEDLG